MPRRRRAAAALATTLALLGCEASEPLVVERGGPIAEWTHYGGDAGGARWSPLRQITPDNVAHLELAWEFHTGDVSKGDAEGLGKTSFQATPIVVGDTLYFCSPMNRVFALDAETGEARWVADPGVEDTGSWTRACRGVAFARAAEEGECAERIFTATMDARLLAYDARTGAPCESFGASGEVDLARGITTYRRSEYGVTSPPTVIGNVVVVGALVADGRRVDAPGGVVRGFDVRTGALRWAFDPVPPGTAPLPPARDGAPRYHPGTPNAWSIASADLERDLLFVPLGNPSPDFYGGLRDGIDYYGSSVVALRGSTGEGVWHFQTVHHDIWDYDVASQPTLLELTGPDGRRVPGLVQTTKMAHVFLLDRESGEPVYAVEERPVPASDVPGETSAPTQPFPTHPPPLIDDVLGPDAAWGIVPWERSACRERLEAVRSGPIFTPPSLEGTLQHPGVAGGSNWGGLAVDRERGLLVLNLNRMPTLQRVVPRGEEEAIPVRRPYEVVFPQLGTPFAEFQGGLLSPLGVPCTRPPWGTLTAVDLASGEKRWEIPFGTTRDMAPFPFWVDWGLPSMGGPIVTASGLVFIGASMDDFLRAYDAESGEELWSVRLPAGGQATPLTYRRAGGRQFVVIAAGGHGSLGTTPGDSLLAFALPVPEEISP
jgi:quinoprotein glucose dehydrogenase